MQNIGLIPLTNFAEVETDLLYRSAQPEYLYQYKWVKDVLGIDVIINLRSELDHDVRMVSKYDLGIEVIDIDVRDHKEPSIEEANRFMDIIRQCIANKRKVLFHCLHGHGRTSTFCVLARLAQGWTLADALDEERDVFHYSFRHKTQIEFLTNNFSNVTI